MRYNTTYGKYYVYEHILYGRIFWVGSGNWQRPYRFDNRSESWLNYVKNNKNDVQINIVKEFENKQLAYKYEIEHSIMLRNNGEPIQGLIGRKRTPELKRHQSEIMKGHIVSQETRNKIGNIHRNKVISQETRNKMSKSKIGKPSNFLGKHHTEETKRKISKTMKGEL